MLEIIDDSAKHAGHAGAAPGGETHYTVHIISESFEGLSRVQLQRAINMVLAPEFESGLHALSLKGECAPLSLSFRDNLHRGDLVAIFSQDIETVPVKGEPLARFGNRLGLMNDEAGDGYSLFIWQCPAARAV